jgi:hypothetical protein
MQPFPRRENHFCQEALNEACTLFVLHVILICHAEMQALELPRKWIRFLSEQSRSHALM